MLLKEQALGGSILSGQLARHPLFVVAMFAPAVLLIVGLILYPFLNGIALSFTDASPLYQTTNFIGLDNYVTLLDDPTFREVVANTLEIVIGSVVVAGIIGFMLDRLMFALQAAFTYSTKQ
mgnify:CR=1 FL=1